MHAIAYAYAPEKYYKPTALRTYSWLEMRLFIGFPSSRLKDDLRKTAVKKFTT